LQSFLDSQSPAPVVQSVLCVSQHVRACNGEGQGQPQLHAALTDSAGMQCSSAVATLASGQCCAKVHISVVPIKSEADTHVRLSGEFLNMQIDEHTHPAYTSCCDVNAERPGSPKALSAGRVFRYHPARELGRKPGVCCIGCHPTWARIDAIQLVERCELLM
jgi:hypothetical protein